MEFRSGVSGDSGAVQARSFGVSLEVLLPIQFRQTDPSLFLPASFELGRYGGQPASTIALERTGSAQYGIRVGGRWKERQLTHRDGLARLRKHIEIQVAEHAPDHVFLHAGVVEWNGVTILLPGRTCAGKSTLVWALVRAGATYLSDEFALLDRRKGVTAYPAPLTLRASGRRRVVAQPRTDFAERRSPGLILFTEYRPGSAWKPRLVTPGAAALRLFQNSVAARTNPERVLKIVGKLAQAVPAYSSKRSGADEVVGWLRDAINKGSLRRNL